MKLISLLFDSQHSTTVLIYIAIFVFTTIFAFKANKRIRNINMAYKTRRIDRYFAVSFLIAWFFYAFGNVGADLEMYRSVYSSANFSNGWIFGTGLETGYRILNALLHSVVKNDYIGIGIIKSIQIILVFISIWMLKDRIHVGYAVMAYMALFYFEAFNLIRISLAAAISMVSVALLIKKKKLAPFMLGLVATSIHTSALVFLVAIIGCLIYQKTRQTKKIMRIAVIMVVPFVILLSGQIVAILIESGYFMDRYSNYVTNTGGIGVMQVLFYFPVFISLYALKQFGRDKINQELYDLLFVFSICGFVVAMCGYSIGMLARAAVFFFVPFGIVLPFYIDGRQNNTIRGKKIFRVRDCKAIYSLYFVGRFMLSMSGYYFTSKLYDFELVFGSLL